ncbi:hypothetical protein DUNSADRAFT_5708 [Dunaliella salina]|uniref:Uncharacterized protein n=1 Tax=Dunaliella salina TaxID=3046 RepID=A0ABQ7GPQ8_DUNSA|nr:hypothetical protein DUNSADRAFT_5708 [Dunaliella salina]|eukprot:KAF5836591.1 hypothetical protein DUNSADRAFT_5708 [Dunaliella salina]
MMYPQFLFGLLKVAEKRRSGFQEVVARIIENVSAVPRASMADLLIFQNTGDPKQAEEWVARPRGLPQLPRTANGTAERMEREAALAKNLKLPSQKLDTQGSKSLSKSMQSSTALGESKQSGSEPLQAQEAGKNGHQEEELQISQALASIKQQKRIWGLQGYGSAESLGLPCVGQAALNDPRALIAVRKLNPDQLMMGLKRVFERYNLWQHGTNKGAMDKARFNKMMRDAKFVRECGALSSSTSDRIFQRSLPAVEVTLNFMQFLTALKHVAGALRLSLNEVMESIVLINAPLATE